MMISKLFRVGGFSVLAISVLFSGCIGDYEGPRLVSITMGTTALEAGDATTVTLEVGGEAVGGTIWFEGSGFGPAFADPLPVQNGYKVQYPVTSALKMASGEYFPELILKSWDNQTAEYNRVGLSQTYTESLIDADGFAGEAEIGIPVPIVSVTGLPDLSVAILAVLAGATTARVTYEVRNNGAESAGQFSVEVWAHLDTPPALSTAPSGFADSFLSLPPGESVIGERELLGSWAAATTFSAHAYVDFNDELREQNEVNNVGSYSWFY